MFRRVRHALPIERRAHNGRVVAGRLARPKVHAKPGAELAVGGQQRFALRCRRERVGGTRLDLADAVAQQQLHIGDLRACQSAARCCQRARVPTLNGTATRDVTETHANNDEKGGNAATLTGVRSSV